MTASADSSLFHERLLQALEEARRQGLSQEKLATRIDVCPNTIGNWKKGTHKPHHENLKALSAELDIPIVELTGTKSKTPRSKVKSPAERDASAEVLKRLAELDLLEVFERLRMAEPQIQQLAGAIPDLLGVLAEAQRHAEGPGRHKT